MLFVRWNKENGNNLKETFYSTTASSTNPLAETKRFGDPFLGALLTMCVLGHYAHCCWEWLIDGCGINVSGRNVVAVASDENMKPELFLEVMSRITYMTASLKLDGLLLNIS